MTNFSFLHCQVLHPLIPPINPSMKITLLSHRTMSCIHRDKQASLAITKPTLLTLIQRERSHNLFSLFTDKAFDKSASSSFQHRALTTTSGWKLGHSSLLPLHLLRRRCFEKTHLSSAAAAVAQEEQAMPSPFFPLSPSSLLTRSH